MRLRDVRSEVSCVVAGQGDPRGSSRAPMRAAPAPPPTRAQLYACTCIERPARKPEGYQIPSNLFRVSGAPSWRARNDSAATAGRSTLGARTLACRQFIATAITTLMALVSAITVGTFR